MNNKTLLIIGMHRSGTSLTAGWLQLCGLNIGENLLGKGVGNLKGHFEDKEFFDIHQEILKFNNTNHHVGKGNQLKVTKNHIAKIESIIANKNSKNIQWGWKEPRTCLFLNSIYHKLLPEAKCIIIYRPYNEVIDSFYRREVKVLKKRNVIKKMYHWAFKIQKSKDEKINTYLKSWIRYNTDILHFIATKKKQDVIVIGLSELIKDCKYTFQLIQDQFGFDLNFKNINDFYDEKLLHLELEKYPCSKELIIEAQLIEEKLKALSLPQ